MSVMVVIVLLISMIVVILIMCSGLLSNIFGLNSMLIEMKNSIENVLCSGSVLLVVCWLNFDLCIIILVKNVLSVNDMLNSFVVLNVMLIVVVIM